MITLNNTVYLGKAMPASSGIMPTFKKVIIKDTTIPTASAANAGYMYIYAGETNATYTHGYIYENQYLPNYAGTITFSPATISVTDANYSAFLNAGTKYISNPDAVTHGTMTYHENSTIWRMVCLDADNNQVGIRQLYQSDFEDAGFVFTGTFADGDVVNFTTTISETSSSYKWVRIDVQPGSTVDQAYDPNSRNAQSGIAVAEALDTLPVEPEWQKPEEWPDMRSGALPNSVYFLVGHSADYTSYPTFTVKATIYNSGTYDVYVDGIKQATTASGTATVLNWQMLALTSGWEVTYPAALRTHIVRVTPSSNSNYCTAITVRNTNQQNGIMWAHFTTTHAIDLDYFIGATSTYPAPIMLACTCACPELLVSQRIRNAFFRCENLSVIPVFNFGNTSTTSMLDECISYTKVKKFVAKNFTNTNDPNAPFSVAKSLKSIEFENGILPLAGYNAFSQCEKLVSLPPISGYAGSTGLQNIFFHCDSLKDTCLDLSNASQARYVKLGGKSSNPITGIKALTVSNQAPFDDATSPQLDVSYTGLNRAALVNLFNSMPTVSASQVCNVTGATGAADLTADDLAIATDKGWTVTR